VQPHRQLGRRGTHRELGRLWPAELAGLEVHGGIACRHVEYAPAPRQVRGGGPVRGELLLFCRVEVGAEFGERIDRRGDARELELSLDRPRMPGQIDRVDPIRRVGQVVERAEQHERIDVAERIRQERHVEEARIERHSVERLGGDAAGGERIAGSTGRFEPRRDLRQHRCHTCMLPPPTDIPFGSAGSTGRHPRPPHPAAASTPASSRSDDGTHADRAIRSFIWWN